MRTSIGEGSNFTDRIEPECRLQEAAARIIEKRGKSYGRNRQSQRAGGGFKFRDS
jgi:hypothetical protein